MSALEVAGDDSVERCRRCKRRPAAGPCARCRELVCGDCSVLSSGGASMFAICTACAAGGSSLRRPWVGFVMWIGGLVIVLAAIAAVLVFAR